MDYTQWMARFKSDMSLASTNYPWCRSDFKKNRCYPIKRDVPECGQLEIVKGGQTFRVSYDDVWLS